MNAFFQVFFILVFVHLLMDYPLQSDFVAKGKNHLKPFDGVNPYLLLASHSFMQAMGVYLVTLNPFFAFIEFVIHGYIDYLKSDMQISFTTDQMLHIGLKVIFAILFVL